MWNITFVIMKRYMKRWLLSVMRLFVYYLIDVLAIVWDMRKRGIRGRGFVVNFFFVVDKRTTMEIILGR